MTQPDRPDTVVPRFEECVRALSCCLFQGRPLATPLDRSEDDRISHLPLHIVYSWLCHWFDKEQRRKQIRADT